MAKMTLHPKLPVTHSQVTNGPAWQYSEFFETVKGYHTPPVSSLVDTIQLNVFASILRSWTVKRGSKPSARAEALSGTHPYRLSIDIRQQTQLYLSHLCQSQLPSNALAMKGALAIFLVIFNDPLIAAFASLEPANPSDSNIIEAGYVGWPCS
ncbi:hypothetical protein SISSUDRAFT_1066323 [Sistotremastrum suecicum HHB10207 ss-3]|uniref:Uncharacterized protein n=1 Tax=Sistotremastrum suecicum HHB10207 ss-3 TaxID=1314776 RepID=A0A165YFZ9_9AGAM|nr:hypothetical protein SISSUDRAFT_1066323 [Sistotremastrum suecicum HHB10207 ss-3]